MKHFSRAPGGFIKSDGTKTEVYEWFTVEVWQQPLWSWLVATVYHWYNMRICKVPGFKVAEWIWDKLHWRSKVPFEYQPLAMAQDVKCYYLTNKKRKVLATFRVEKDSEIVRASGWE